MSGDWWYRIWWRGFSGRIHKFEKKVTMWNGTLITKTGHGLPPAIAHHVVRSKKIRRVNKSER